MEHLPFPPQFFDIFGVITFLYIIYFALTRIADGKKPAPLWTLLVLLGIGLGGLIIDGAIVYFFYLKS
jgi:hypothetical protein